MGRVRILGAQIPPQARQAFRPLVEGNLTEIEKRLIPQMRAAFQDHMKRVVDDCMAITPIKDNKGAIRRQLIHGIKVYGTKLDTLRTEVFAPEYVHAHEYGATIRPKAARVLALPMPAALRPDGSPKFSGPRAWKRYKTFSYQSKRTRRGYLAYKNAAGKLVLLYVYVDIVRLMPRLGLRKSYNRLFGALLAEWGEIMVREMKIAHVEDAYRKGLAGQFRPTQAGFRNRKK